MIGEDSLNDFMDVAQILEVIVERVERYWCTAGRPLLLLTNDTPSTEKNRKKAEIALLYPDRIHFANAPCLEVSSAEHQAHDCCRQINPTPRP